MATIASLHAHPDDEALLTGGWLAQRAALGDRVVIIFATDGDAGLAALADDTLGRRRRDEAMASAQALGAARVVWLGYRDSGMVDASTRGPGRFVDVAVSDAARAVAAILDEEEADILTGYDANGGYGHPDHIHVHRVARAAQSLATNRPQLLEATIDRTWLVRVLRVLRPISRVLPGMTIPGNDIYTGRADVSETVDVRKQFEAKRAALAAHASQRGGGVRTISILLALPRPVARRVLGSEWFHSVA